MHFVMAELGRSEKGRLFIVHKIGTETHRDGHVIVPDAGKMRCTKCRTMRKDFSISCFHISALQRYLRRMANPNLRTSNKANAKLIIGTPEQIEEQRRANSIKNQRKQYDKIRKSVLHTLTLEEAFNISVRKMLKPRYRVMPFALYYSQLKYATITVLRSDDRAMKARYKGITFIGMYTHEVDLLDLFADLKASGLFKEKDYDYSI